MEYTTATEDSLRLARISTTPTTGGDASTTGDAAQNSAESTEIAALKPTSATSFFSQALACFKLVVEEFVGLTKPMGVSDRQGHYSVGC